jgi:G:T/U-mismatch repair DNA glycosylase
LFRHTHPYPPFNLGKATKLIVGTLPPPRFTIGKYNPCDVNFSYGSIDGQLWTILNSIFNVGLVFETTQKAIEQRQALLINNNIGIFDIVASAKRDKIDASDLGMQEVEFRDLISVLEKYPKLDTLLFTGGNSKNRPEYFFRKVAKASGFVVNVIHDQVPRIHSFQLPISKRIIHTVCLTAPSGAANRAVGSLKAYKEMKVSFPHKNSIDLRIEQYPPYFTQQKSDWLPNRSN